MNGAAVGIGTTLLPHCDLVLVSDTARFKLPFVALGLVPEAASSLLLPAVIGPQAAAHLLLTGDWMDAEEAVARGLAWKRFAPEELLEETLGLARRIAAAPLEARPQHQAAAAGRPVRGGGGGHGPGSRPPRRDRPPLRRFLKKPSDGPHHRFTAGVMSPPVKINWRVPQLPWRRIGIGFVAVVFLLVAVPPLRRAVAFGTSRAILWAASPITPFVPDFSRFPDTTQVLAADGSELAALSGEDGRRQVVELDAVPEHVRRAVLAAEDADFYRHSGVNPLSIMRAVVSTALGHTQGGSTITQQLAKLNYTGSRRSVFRKFSEVFYASALEQRYSKDELLRRYLNHRGETAQERQQLRGALASGVAREWLVPVDDRPERLGAPVLGDEALGGPDDVEGVGLARLGGVAPGRDAVAPEDDPDGIRPLPADRRDVETELEARPPPGDPRDPIPEAVARQRLAVGRGGQRDARVRVEVVDVAGIDEPVHGGIDRRGRATASEQAVVERCDHLVLAVDARIDVDEGAQPVEPKHGQTGLGQRAEIAAGPLDPQQLDVTPGHRVGRRPLGGRVATRVVRGARVGAQPPRPLDELVDDGG